MSYTDMTRPNPAWTADQLYVYRERLAIMGEGRPGNTPAEYVTAYRQAEAWKQEKQEKQEKTTC